MIDRYAIYSDFQSINKRFGLKGEEFTVPNYNAAPAQQLPIISSKSSKEITFCFWGTNQEWSNNKSISPKLLSANFSQLKSKTTLKAGLEKKRCIVPVNGFYLWKQYSKKRKTPHYFHNTSQDILSLPAIWEENEDIDGNIHLTFKFIEVPNYINQPEFGTMMPGILPLELEQKWLDDYTSIDEAMEILSNTEMLHKMTFHPVSPHIAVVSNNNETLIERQSQVDQLGNYTLFE